MRPHSETKIGCGLLIIWLRVGDVGIETCMVHITGSRGIKKSGMCAINLYKDVWYVWSFC